MTPQKWDNETLSYAAGFLDGEGCFTSGPTGKIAVTMANTYLPVVKWFQSKFGGAISKGNKRKIHHRYCYTWIVTGDKAEELCRYLCGHLKQKAPQAALLICIRQLLNHTQQGKTVSCEIKEERLRLQHFLKELKHVEYQ